MEVIDKIMKMVTGKTKEEREEIAKVKRKIQRRKQKGYWKGRLENAEEEGKIKAKKELKDMKKSLEKKDDGSEFNIVDGWKDKKENKGSYFG